MTKVIVLSDRKTWAVRSECFEFHVTDEQLASLKTGETTIRQVAKERTAATVSDEGGATTTTE